MVIVLATARQLLHCEELGLVLPNVVPTQAIWRTVEGLCALQNTQTLAIVYGPSDTSRAFVVTSRPAVVGATACLRFGDTPGPPDVTMAMPNSDLIAIRRVNMSFTTGVLGLIWSQRGEE